MPNYDTTYPSGITPRSFASNLSRTATSAAELMVLPPYSVIKSIAVIGPKSNAGTSGRVSLGSNGGTMGALLANFNVKTNGEVSYPSSFNPDWAASDPNPVVVVGLYAEDGSASSSGGPWKIVVDVL